MGKLAQHLSGKSNVPKMYAKGGAVHSDAAQDKKLISKMIKSAEKKEEAAEGKKCGGKVKK